MEKNNERLAYSVNEVAEMTGLCTKTVYNLVSSGKLKAFKVGRTWRIKTEDLNEFMQTN